MKTSGIYSDTYLVLGYIFLCCIGCSESGRTISELSATCFILALLLLLSCIYIINFRKKKKQESKKESEGIRNMEQNAILQKLIDEQLQETSADIRNSRWNRIKKEIDRVHDHFTTKLKVRFSALKEDEIHLCCLIRVGMDNYGITRCLDISKDYLRTKKSRLAKTLKVSNQKGELKRFILEF